MTIRHHPDVATLAAFAFGSLDKARAFVVAAHVHQCAKCRSIVRNYEVAGGAMLEDSPPAQLSMAASETMLGMILHGADAQRSTAPEPQDDVSLQSILTDFREGPWRWLGPGVYFRPISKAKRGETRLFLLKAAPGTSLPEHTHSGTELTLVLSGAFSHEGGRFARGDIEDADATVEHQPVVDEGEDCVCLVAMDGQLKLKGLLGRLMQPFVRL